MQAEKLLGQQGGIFLDSTSETGNWACGRAITDCTINAITQPGFSPVDGLSGTTVAEGDYVYGSITSIDITGKMQLFRNSRRD